MTNQQTLIRQAAVLNELEKGPRTVNELCEAVRVTGVSDGWYGEIYSSVRALERRGTVIVLRCDNRMLVGLPEV